jgi:hypothetical protein
VMQKKPLGGSGFVRRYLLGSGPLPDYGQGLGKLEAEC